MKLKDLIAKREQKNARLTELLAKGEEMTEDEIKEASTLDGELDALDSQITEAKRLDDIRQKAAKRQAEIDTVQRPELGGGEPDGNGRKQIVIPATVMKSRVTSFSGPDAREKAYAFGQWFLGGVLGNEKARAWCQEHGIAIKTHQESRNERGGVLVPPEFEGDMIDLREMFGVFRKFAKKSPMRGDTKRVPRRTGGLTAYPVGEGVGITESEKGWDSIELTARKWGVLALYSSELDEDAIIDIGNDLAEEIAYAFAQCEDDAGWNGDGTSTYHRIVGVLPKLRGLDNTIANIAGLVVGSGNAWGELTLDDFTKVKGRLPQYADRPDTGWFCHKSFYNEVMETLMLEAGGVAAAEVAAGRKEPIFLGYPVYFSQKLPRTEADSQISCLYGSLRLGVTFGDRRQMTIATSEHLKFAEDELAIRGTERFDINVHDVGNASATAADRQAGPIVGLITAAA